MIKLSTNYYQFLDSFIFEKEAQGLSKATIESYSFTANKFLKFLGNNTISKEQYYKFINTIDVRGETKKHYGRELRVFLYWLMEEELIDKFKVNLPKCQEPQPRIPSTEEVKRLLEKPGKSFTQERMWVIVNLVISIGLRARTIANLKVSDISFEQKQLLLRETKNKKLAIIPLNDSLLLILNKYIRKWNLTNWLFPNNQGEQLTVEGLLTAYERYSKQHNCSQHGIHSLRHYMATEAIRAGVSVFSLKQILQHSDLEVTMKYVNLVNADLQNDLQKYNPINRLTQ